MIDRIKSSDEFSFPITITATTTRHKEEGRGGQHGIAQQQQQLRAEQRKTVSHVVSETE